MLQIIPTTPTGYALNRKRGALSIVVPEATVNLVKNPSFELNTDGWATTGSNLSINRTNGVGLFGSYGLIVIYSGLTSANAGVRYTFGASVALSGIYTASCYIIAPFNTLIELRVNGVTVASAKGRGPGRWLRLVGHPLQISSAGSATIDIVRPATSAINASVTIDGVQFEQKPYATTYCDGDQAGFVSRQIAYLWAGQAHASTSQRLGATRAGGRIVRLDMLGYLVLSILGMSMAPVNLIALPVAQGGAYFQNAIPQTRTMSLVGDLSAGSEQALDQRRDLLTQYISPTLLRQPQPLRMIFENYAQDGITPISLECDLVCHYSGGLEGIRNGLFQERSTPEFQMFMPFFLRTGTDSQALAVQESVLDADFIVARDRTGQWSALDQGLTGAAAFAIVQGNDGYRYVGGAFSDASGVANTAGIARWDLASGGWFEVDGGTAGTGNVFALAIGADGAIYAGGNFTSMSAVANTAGLAKYTPSTDTWSSIGTVAGGSAVVDAIAIAPNGDIYVGGNFTSVGGTAALNIARYNGSAWVALGTGANDTVWAIAINQPGNQIYIGGEFTLAGGVANTVAIACWDGAAWVALASGMGGGDVYSLAFGPNQALYIGGTFTSGGGINADEIATWNGTAFAELGGGVTPGTNIIELVFDTTGRLHLAGSFTTAGNVTIPDGYAVWNGSSYSPGDINMAGVSLPSTIAAFPNGDVWLGSDASGTAIAASITTISYDGTAPSYPTFVITGPTSGAASALYQLINITTGAAIYFNLSLLVGEIVTLNLDPQSASYGLNSSTRGNLIANILAGSNLADFTLQPGDNEISAFAAGSTMTVTASWRVAYAAIEHTVLK